MSEPLAPAHHETPDDVPTPAGPSIATDTQGTTADEIDPMTITQAQPIEGCGVMLFGLLGLVLVVISFFVNWAVGAAMAFVVLGGAIVMYVMHDKFKQDAARGVDYSHRP